MMKLILFSWRNLLFIALIVLLSAYLFISRLPFPGADSLFFTEPAYSLLRGGPYAVPSVTGLFTGIEKVLACYPPVYSYLCYFWFKLFGFSMTHNLCLSLILCAAIACAQLLLFRKVLGKNLPLYIYGLTFFSWTIAIVQVDRPDILVTLFGLLAFLFMPNKRFTGQPLIIHLIIAALLALAIAATPGPGILMTMFLLFVRISYSGLSMRIISRFLAKVLVIFTIAALIWAIPVVRYYGFPLIKTQLTEALTLELGPVGFAHRIWDGLVFNSRYGFTLFYTPLLLCSLIFSLIYIFSEKNEAEKTFFAWQCMGIVIVFLILILTLPGKDWYRQIFFAFLVYVCGIASLRLFEQIKNAAARLFLILILFLCLGIAYLPFARTALFPLTWSREDTYEYNKKIILSAIPKGSPVLTSSRFWFALADDYVVFDGCLGSSNITRSDYVLLVSGGGGRPGIAPPTFLNTDRDYPYFLDNFQKELSTMLPEPNKLFGIPISRSRWCYRFELYKRKK